MRTRSQRGLESNHLHAVCRSLAFKAEKLAGPPSPSQRCCCRGLGILQAHITCGLLHIGFQSTLRHLICTARILAFTKQSKKPSVGTLQKVVEDCKKTQVTLLHPLLNLSFRWWGQRTLHPVVLQGQLSPITVEYGEQVGGHFGVLAVLGKEDVESSNADISGPLSAVAHSPPLWPCSQSL